jgi:hypothetical protein
MRTAMATTTFIASLVLSKAPMRAHAKKTAMTNKALVGQLLTHAAEGRATLGQSNTQSRHLKVIARVLLLGWGGVQHSLNSTFVFANPSPP